MVWRLVWGAIRLVVALAVVAALAGAYLFWRAMPTYSGSEKLPGLSAEVHVWRDGYGVPHIFAASMDDAARALGYLHASERLFQMELQRRVGQGRLAEVFGADRLERRQVHPHARLLPRGGEQLRRAVALGAEAARRPTPTASTPSSTATRTRCRPSS